MTRTEYLAYLGTGIVPCTPQRSLPLSASSVCPEVQPHSLTQDVSSSPTKRDFNGMSIKDVQAFHQLRGMDRLHQLDALASMYHRGNALNQVLKSEKSERFVKNHYSKQ